MLLLYFGLVIFAIAYVLFDINYFLRFVVLYVWFNIFNKKKKLLDTITNYGICTTQDIDIVLTHMNNARYLRELDFGRYIYYIKTRLYNYIGAKGAVAFQTASIVRYRQSINIFTPYKITTKLIYWNDKHFYMEQQFRGLRDNFVYTTALTRQTLIKTKIPIEDILAEIEPEIRKPEPTKELQLWLESIEESSQNLRKQK